MHKRYSFQVYFYTSDANYATDTFSEYYFGEFVPDPK
jgi:hypothetical protein